MKIKSDKSTSRGRQIIFLLSQNRASIEDVGMNKSTFLASAFALLNSIQVTEQLIDVSELQNFNDNQIK